jgi:hypothetical protein
MNDPDSENKFKKQLELERRVLHQLRERKEPVNWDELYVHFDLHRTGEIEPVLHNLKVGHYIAVDQEKNVSISEIGLKRLSEECFRSPAP